jgi:hypothetical protein
MQDEEHEGHGHWGMGEQTRDTYLVGGAGDAEGIAWEAARQVRGCSEGA